MDIQSAQWTAYRARIARNIVGKLSFRFLICDSKATAGVNVIDPVSISSQVANQIGYPRQTFSERSDVRNLRADMNTNARDLQISCARSHRVELASIANRHPELVLTQTSGNVRMSISGYVGIHTQSHGSNGS